MKDFEYYRQRFLSGVQMTKDVDYGDKASVRKNNRGVDQYRKAAVTIREKYPDRIPEFALLLDHEDHKVQVACAVSLVELMNAASPHREKALDIIRAVARDGDPLERMGWGEWLKRRGVV